MKKSATVLVTGGTGFVGLRLIFTLLQQGYTVRTTVRQLSSKDKIIAALSEHGILDLEQLSFIEAELTDDRNWDAAMQGSTYVLSVASPVFFDIPEDENEAIRPAVEGIRRVLKFAQQAGVKRVVMTSNFGAVGFSQTDKTRQTTEEDWTDVHLKGLSVYEKSKTLAEKAAWYFIRTEGDSLELAVINAVAIYGPALDAHVSGSFHLLTNLLNGSMKLVPNIPLNVVDIRDVAELHIRAMITPEANGQRFIAAADGQITLPGIAALLKTRLPEVSGKVSMRRLPDLLVRFAALFNRKAREGVVFLNMNRNISNAKARQALGWKPIASQEEAILTGVASMARYRMIS
ncbi:SDR family oxidoreductase [Mucilaginibacter flavus]|uniref:SDR family oxidoreductase n=1 Tax=Mucilaginibacter flavus TaxID=931504 RepID=UPI0025B4C589|nr:aldehyde reductase [Mucilaginibacter flavus]MDN3583421.1 aldehyde reductase [Mucilaginibacter flavus]